MSLYQVNANVSIIIEAQDSEDAEIAAVDILSQNCLDIDIQSGTAKY